MRFFPFDEQECVIDFKAEANTNQTLKLVPARVRYLGPVAMVEFTVSNVTFGPGVLKALLGRKRVKNHMRIIFRKSKQVQE